MQSNRADLNNLDHQGSYLTLTIIFVFLSFLGILLFFQIIKNRSTITVSSAPTPTVTPNIDQPNLYPSIPSRPEINLTQTPTLTTLPSILPTLISPTDTPIPIPTSQFLNYSSSSDKFSVVYRSSRKFYIDKEGSGNRYTFYRTDGNIAIHIGQNWSWEYPNRTFNQDFTVDGQSTFRYDIPSQTIVDIQTNGLLYTIQCIHSGKSSLKIECDQFLKDFKFL